MQVLNFTQNRHSGPCWPALPCAGAWGGGVAYLPLFALNCVVRMLLAVPCCAILRLQRQNPLPGLVPRKHESAQHAPACFFVWPSSTRNISYGGLGEAASRLAGFLLCK